MASLQSADLIASTQPEQPQTAQHHQAGADEQGRIPRQFSDHPQQQRAAEGPGIDSAGKYAGNLAAHRIGFVADGHGIERRKQQAVAEAEQKAERLQGVMVAKASHQVI